MRTPRTVAAALAVTASLATAAAAAPTTFVNEPSAVGRGNVLVVVNVEGADGVFDFSGDWPDPNNGDATLVGGFSLATEGGSGAQSWTGVLESVGSPYTLVAADPTPDYDLVGLECDDPDDSSSASGMTASLDVDAGETVTCTFTYRQRSTLTIVKDAVPDSGEVFTFLTSGDGLTDTFDLVDDGTATANVFNSGLLPSGASYSVEEVPVPGWTLSTASCDNGDAPSAITPAPGTTVSCTFVNEPVPGSAVEIIKTVEGLPDDEPWHVDFVILPVPGEQHDRLTASGTGDESDAVFWDLVPGEAYTIREVTKDGFDAGPMTCTGAEDLDSDDADASVTLVAPPGSAIGADVTCAITNTARLDADGDGDGVADADDLCSASVLPEPPPSRGLKKHRFIANDAGVFVDRDGNPVAGITVADTGGCTGAQIIERARLGEGHKKWGITRSALLDWTADIT